MQVKENSNKCRIIFKLSNEICEKIKEPGYEAIDKKGWAEVKAIKN